MDPVRPALCSCRRVVVKVGTRVLAHDDGRPALSRLFAIVEQLGALAASGTDVLLVSSGAVGLGREALGLTSAPVQLEERQACAAVGQSRLMQLYSEGFGRVGAVAAQVLLTEGDFDDRVRYLNLRSTLNALLRHGAIPVINENDAVSTEELAFVEGATRPVFGDNDRLSALVATKLDADLLVLLTDVDGVYDRDPRHDDGARLLATVTPATVDSVAAGTGGAAEGLSRGGMRSKVEAAKIAQASGCHAVIASGLAGDSIARAIAGSEVGTWFPATDAPNARRRWIAWAAAARGALHLDPGAVAALRDRGASLLAVGVTRVEGDFGPGDIVTLHAPDGSSVGRGIAHCDAPTARSWAAGQMPDGVRNHDALVHRDNLVLE
ncbi:MAG: glutamate 5-kinase [Proteobacteria bacterium]|nr:glutamate 5-kinase [Pseudomonadota bacterium]